MMPDKKTVVFFTNSFPNRLQPHRGVFTEQLAAAAGSRIDPVIICPLPWVPRVGLLERFSSQYLFARIPREYDYNGFHVYSPKYPVVPKIPWLSPWSMALGSYPLLKRLAGARRIDVINAQSAFPEGIAAVWLAKRLGVPAVITAVGSDINEAAGSGLRLRMTRSALQQARYATAKSTLLGEKIILMGVEPGRVHYTPNGVDTSLFHPRDKSACREMLGLNSSGRIVLFVGKFRPVKGIRYLLEALHILARQGKLDFDTALIGSGPEERDYRGIVEARGLSRRVLFAGNRSHREVALWMGASDLFCLPSLKEGMPNVVLEALAGGLPVAASRVGAIPELIKEHSGILVPPADPEALARAVRAGIDGGWDPGLISASVRDMTWERAAQRYLEVFSRC
ncbi:MAG TPA: glycosyltransferase family 4 protein [Desulfomonilia bacterium]|nr:glycosyltransferase family 4 protein [Desulfomonilia bacterium]